MKLLITGGCGFIGSNFINNYFINNNNLELLVNLDALHYCANIKNINENIRNSESYKFINGNICDTDLVTFILYNYKEILLNKGKNLKAK